MRPTSWNTLTDAQKLWVLLRDAGPKGVHSHDLRAQGVSGNPSQRAKDVVTKGQPVFTARESRNGRPGSRYWLAPSAPDWSVPVAPNFGSAAASVEESEGGGEPVEGQIETEEPRRLTLVWDFTGDESTERWEVAA